MSKGSQKLCKARKDCRSQEHVRKHPFEIVAFGLLIETGLKVQFLPR